MNPRALQAWPERPFADGLGLACRGAGCVNNGRQAAERLRAATAVQTGVCSRPPTTRRKGEMMTESISPAERVKINQLVFRLGMTAIPSDTNVMAWVLPVLEVVVKRFEDQEGQIRVNERRIVELEIAMKERR